MCGGYRLEADPEDLAEFFGARIGQLDLPLQVEDRFPGQQAPTLIGRRLEDGVLERRLGPLSWGLVPRWAKSPEIGAKLYNARAETLESKPSFRDSFSARRCLVPVSCFYEWKREGQRSVRHSFRAASDPWFALAGLWDMWRDPAGVVTGTFTIVTTDANECVSPIHHRMPVVVPRDLFDAWLEPAPLANEARERLLAPCPASWLVGSLAAPASDD